MPQVRLLSDLLVRHTQKYSQISWEWEAPLEGPILLQIQEAMAELVSWKGKHLFSQLPHQVIYTDASDWGWGATLDMYQDDTTHGWFQGPKLREHINYKEAEAVVESILYYNLSQVHLQLWIDNTTVWWYIHKWGGRVQKLNEVVRRLWVLCQQRGITITPHYIPTQLNPADKPSRAVPHPLHQSSLQSWVMEHIHQVFLKLRNFTPEWDWMASQDNAVCQQFITEEQNLFTQDLTKITPGWVNPPWFLIPRVLGYLQTFPSQVKVLMVVPHHHRAPWWPLWEKLQDTVVYMAIQPQLLFQDPWGTPIPGPPGPLCFCILQGGGHQHL
jgi:hypothetical protein